MEKKYLGMGYTFAALDEGLSNYIRSVSQGLQGISKDMEGTNKSGKSMFDEDGAFGKMEKFAKLGLMGRISSQLSDLKKSLTGESRADIAFVNLEEFERDMKVLYGMSEQNATEIRRNIIDIAKTTGASQDMMSSAIKNITEGGAVGIDEAMKHAKMMGQMMGQMKLDTSDVVNIYREGLSPRLKMTGEQMDALIKQTAAYGQAFNLGPDKSLKMLNSAIMAVNEHAAFKNLKGDAAKAAAQGIARLSVMFERLGKGPEQATAAATDMFARMKTQEKAFAKLMAGLGGEVDDFYKNVLISGQQKAVEAMKSNDPATALFTLRDVLGKMSKAGPMALQTTKMWIEDAFGGDMLNAALANAGDLYQKHLQGINTDGNKFMDQYTAATNSMMSQQEKYKDASEDAMKLEAKFAAKKDIVSALILQVEAYDMITKKIREGNSELGAFIVNSEKLAGGGINAFIKSPSWATFSASVGTIGEYLGKIVETLAGLGFFFHAFKGSVGIVKKIGTWLWKPFEILANKLGVTEKYFQGFRPLITRFRFQFMKLSNEIGGLAGMASKLAKGLWKAFTWPLRFIGNMAKALTNIKGNVVGMTKYAGNLFKVFKAGGFSLKFLGMGLKFIGKLLSRILFPIGLVIAAVESLVENWGQLKDAFTSFDMENFWASMGNVGKAIGDFLLQGVNKFFFGLPEMILGAWVTSIDGIKLKLQDVLIFLAESLQKIPFLGKSLISNDLIATMKEVRDDFKKAYDNTMQLRGHAPAQDNVVDLMKEREKRQQLPGGYQEDKLTKQEDRKDQVSDGQPQAKRATEIIRDRNVADATRKEAQGHGTTGLAKPSEIANNGDMAELIASAIEEGFNRILATGTAGPGAASGTNITVVLEGDVRKFMRVQKQMTDNMAASRGTYQG